jgi:2,3-bisphosphoglycerate-independent phosphoglycerate mutase
MIDSPKITTYDLQPEMSAPEVTLNIISELEKNETDFICLNFANPDMVGHTGDYNAIIKAIETVDNSARQIIEVGLKNNYAFIVISDHGNADFTINSDGTPNTEHSKNPVPCFAIGTGFNTIENGILADVAPTILHIMGIKIPEEMTGNILVN